MTTELQRAAREAWAMMDDTRSKLQRMVDQMAGDNRGPMAPDIALDYVQNATGERDDAVTALLGAGADWLDEVLPDEVACELDASCRSDAKLVTLNIRGELLGMAEVFREHIYDRCAVVATYGTTHDERSAARGWDLWAYRARLALQKCRAVVAAAYPEPTGEAA